MRSPTSQTTDMFRVYLDYFPSPFPENSLATLDPTLAAEWHPNKNSPLTPANFAPNSGHRAWWLCKKGHEWEGIIGSRNFGNHRCSYCLGRKATPETSMAVTHPLIASMWHPTKNGDATPFNTKAGSGIRRWWVCPKKPEHEWHLTPDKMKHPHPTGYCPHCRKERQPPLAISHPEISGMWHPTKNVGTTPNDVTYGSSATRWWVCPDSPEHEWEVSPSNITKPGRILGFCPFCSGRRKLRS